MATYDDKTGPYQADMQPDPAATGASHTCSCFRVMGMLGPGALAADRDCPGDRVALAEGQARCRMELVGRLQAGQCKLAPRSRQDSQKARTFAAACQFCQMGGMVRHRAMEEEGH